MIDLIVILVRIVVAFILTILLVLAFPIELMFFILWVTILALSGKSRSETKYSSWKFPASLRVIPDLWIWVFKD